MFRFLRKLNIFSRQRNFQDICVRRYGQLDSDIFELSQRVAVLERLTNQCNSDAKKVDNALLKINECIIKSSRAHDVVSRLNANFANFRGNP